MTSGLEERARQIESFAPFSSSTDMLVEWSPARIGCCQRLYHALRLGRPRGVKYLSTYLLPVLKQVADWYTCADCVSKEHIGTLARSSTANSCQVPARKATCAFVLMLVGGRWLWRLGRDVWNRQGQLLHLARISARRALASL